MIRMYRKYLSKLKRVTHLQILSHLFFLRAAGNRTLWRFEGRVFGASAHPALSPFSSRRDGSGSWEFPLVFRKEKGLSRSSSSTSGFSAQKDFLKFVNGGQGMNFIYTVFGWPLGWIMYVCYLIVKTMDLLWSCLPLLPKHCSFPWRSSSKSPWWNGQFLSRRWMRCSANIKTTGKSLMKRWWSFMRRNIIIHERMPSYSDQLPDPVWYDRRYL